MNRREFEVLLSLAATWSMPALAQHGKRSRRIDVLMNLAADDPESQARLTAFVQSLQQLGWTDGHNVSIETRWAAADADRFRRYAAEFAALAPDVILASGSSSLGPLLQATRTVPVVFVNVPDPVGAGFVHSLAQPGGNATGFSVFEYGIGSKWVELLKEIAPNVTRVAVLRDPSFAAGIGLLAAMQAVAPALRMELTPIDVRDPGDFEHGITEFARLANGELVVPASPSQGAHRELIIALAARHRLPAVYPFRYMVTGGGLISYGPDITDQYRRAADYVDRILKGEKPAELPVQEPVKYELAINLKTAKVLGLDLPATVLARADEVIE
jgi:putative tryptophan/tyrosine transport system substrate-binding protein